MSSVKLCFSIGSEMDGASRFHLCGANSSQECSHWYSTPSSEMSKSFTALYCSVGVDQMSFNASSEVGSILEMKAQVNRIFSTSMEVFSIV